MWSLLVLTLIILFSLPDRTSSFETIQAALASTVELPCSITIGPNIEATNPAKVSAGRDKCLYVLSRVCYCWYAAIVLFKEERESSFQGVHNHDDITISYTAGEPLDVYTYSLIITKFT
jgi:hypothetical protein